MKKRVKPFLFIIFWSLLVVSCFALSSSPLASNGFTIIGHIDGIEDGTLVTLYDSEQQIDIDSAFTLKGDFKMSGKVEKPTACRIRSGNEYAIIHVENVVLYFTSPLKDMFLNSVTRGGKEQDLQNELHVLQRPFEMIYFKALDSLMQEKYANEEEKQDLIKRYQKFQTASHEIYINFGKKHADSYLGLDIVYRNRKNIPKDTLALIYENLSPSFQATPSAKALKVFLYDTAIEKGKSFIDFVAKSLDGKDFKLSSLKGKYIYLSFWSMGCGPCRMENKFLSKNYDRVPEELAIVSFSIDKNVSAWEKASATDGIVWYNVSDQGGSQGKVKTQYQVQAIPTSFLIDKEGEIMEIYGGFDPDGDLIEEIIARIEKSK